MKVLQIKTSQARELFQQSFGHQPQWTAIAPGRVNLIGEHTDYNLLPVLPMTIDRAISIHGRTRSDSLVRLLNADADFPIAEISLDKAIEPLPGHWSNYVRAAVHAVVSGLRNNGATIHGFDAVIDSDLPPAAGLSSSSALVIASCLALLHANNVQWPMIEVAERMRLAEQFVGTAGGGMDQAVIALGEKNSALLIEFDPLHVSPVSVPADLSVFIINSGQKAEKMGSARYAYNLRALTCAISVAVLRKSAANLLDTSNWTSLRDVYRSCAKANITWSELLLRHLSVDPAGPDQKSAGVLPTNNHSLSVESLAPADLMKIISHDELEDMCQTRKLSLDKISEWLPGGTFHIYSRAAHVLGEADRVYAFRDALAQDDITSACHIANASHASCRDLYHISTPGLEKLVQQARLAGAGAARITGAGFGGCLVALVPAANSGTFREKLQAQGVAAAQIIEAHPEGPARVHPSPAPVH